MKQNRGLLIGLVLLAVIVIAGLIAVDSAKKTTKDNSSGAIKTSSAATAANTSPASKADTSSATATTSVDIKDYMFNPMDIKVKVGDSVTWTNQDSVHHNVVADTKSADAPNGPLIGKGETYSFTFKKAGKYSIHCDPHPYMKATVTVTE